MITRPWHWLSWCALVCSACSFHDRHEACESASQCGPEQVCFQGFCVRSDEAVEHELQVLDPQDETRAAPKRGRAGVDAGPNREPALHDPAPGDAGVAAVSGSGGAAASSGGKPSASAGNLAPKAPEAGSGDSGSAMSSTPPPACQPRAEECNGADEDCDGEIDEYTDTDCYPDGQAGCARDAQGRFVCSGTCAIGKRACVDGKLDSCVDYKAPTPELCTEVGMQAADEDCNGVTDEACACTSGEVRSCYDGRAGTRDVGRCKAGTQTCSEGQLGKCEGQITAGVEDCSNMNSDDDCDGELDNVRGLGGKCVVPGAAGSCSSGTLQCEAGASEPRCVGAAPGTETCNGVDDDCDGKVDNGFNLKRDQDNCGACGNKCPGQQVCRQGECTAPMMEGESPGNPGNPGNPPSGPKGCNPECGAGQTCCGNRCVDTDSDAANCGMCGNACGAGAKPGCCGGSCVDLVSDRDCGQCGHDCSLLSNGGITCTCRMNGDGDIACSGPVLNLCL